jgi:hypothetical protein
MIVGEVPRTRAAAALRVRSISSGFQLSGTKIKISLSTNPRSQMDDSLSVKNCGCIPEVPTQYFQAQNCPCHAVTLVENERLMSSVPSTHGVGSQLSVHIIAPRPGTSLHDTHPSSSSRIMTSSAPACTLQSRTVASILLTRTSVRNGLLADPLDTRPEVR